MASKAKCLKKLLSTRRVVAFALFLTDVVGALASLSLVLQRRDATVYECSEYIRETVQSLEKFKAK